MTKQQMSKFIGAGTIATIMLILVLAFGSFNTGCANSGGEGNGFFTSVVSSLGEGEEGDEDENEMEEGGEMGEENEMDDEDEEEDDDD